MNKVPFKVFQDISWRLIVTRIPWVASAFPHFGVHYDWGERNESARGDSACQQTPRFWETPTDFSLLDSFRDWHPVKRSTGAKIIFCLRTHDGTTYKCFQILQICQIFEEKVCFSAAFLQTRSEANSSNVRLKDQPFKLLYFYLYQFEGRLTLMLRKNVIIKP